MNEQKRKILNIALIIINVILVVAIARVIILLYYEFSPQDYQTIICKYNDSSSNEDFFEFINDYELYQSIIKQYTKVKKELVNNDGYVTGNYLKYSKDFFEENNLLIIHTFGFLPSNVSSNNVSYEEAYGNRQVRVIINNEKDFVDKVEYIYMIPISKRVDDARIHYHCSDESYSPVWLNTIVKNIHLIVIGIIFDILVIAYVITNNKKILKVLIISIIILTIVGVGYYLYEESHPSIAEKPIIYLYPKEETQVSVKLGNEDKITCSYPTYTSGGWNVLAKPTGDLIDLNSGRNLYSLYYECDNSAQYTMKNDGFVVESEKLVEFLEEKLSILGLTEREAEEFIVYWLPRLQVNKYNYIRFATMDEINQNMPLEFSTNPDTLIRVLMTYKPLEHPIEVEEQQLSTPERIGFVAVEWGGAQIK